MKKKNYTVSLEVAMDVLVIGAKNEKHAMELAMDADVSNATILGTLECRKITDETELDSCRRHNEETIEA